MCIRDRLLEEEFSALREERRSIKDQPFELDGFDDDCDEVSDGVLEVTICKQLCDCWKLVPEGREGERAAMKINHEGEAKEDGIECDQRNNLGGSNVMMGGREFFWKWHCGVCTLSIWRAYYERHIPSELLRIRLRPHYVHQYCGLQGIGECATSCSP